MRSTDTLLLEVVLVIPKVIYYCWFGNDKPDNVKACINSWKQVLTDYNIVEINESDIDLSLPYNQEMLKSRKYAYLSDCVRLQVLKDNPGIYLDTDMFFVRPFLDEMLDSRLFFGLESTKDISLGVFGVETPNDPFIVDFLKIYEEYDTSPNKVQLTNVATMKSLYDQLGFRRTRTNVIETDRIKLYPREYFYPIPYGTHMSARLTNRTIAIHQWCASAFSGNDPFHESVNRAFDTYKDELNKFFSDNNVTNWTR